MTNPRALVLGGGLSGIAAALSLARAGWEDVTIIEQDHRLGGLAGSFVRDDHFFPLTYHHILHRDRTLLYFLDAMGALSKARWRNIRMLFRLNEQFYDLSSPVDFMRFPMSLPDKARFVRLMLRSFLTSDWSKWYERSASDLVDSWGGPGVRRAIFEPLSQLKFKMPCDEVSAAWLGARLSFREGSAPLGYIPECNWTDVLCDGLTEMLDQAGVRVRPDTSVIRLHGKGDRISHVELDGGEHLEADVVTSALPTEVYRSAAPPDGTPGLDVIHYTAIISVVCATRQRIEPDFYWMNLASLDHQACGIFLLNSLNPSIGAPGDACVNFTTHLPSRLDPLFQRSDAELLEGYYADFQRIFGFDLDPHWTHISRLPMYSPVFHRGYRNPPVRSSSWSNVYFAGNYRTFPSIASTGTALDSGLEAGEAILNDHGRSSELLAQARSFRLRSMPHP